MHRGTWRTAGVAMALLALPAANAQVVDGQNLTTEHGSALAVQRFQTAFGDDMSGDQFGNGNELDALFASNDDEFLYLGVTGNLENNGNAAVIYIDVDGDAGGANLLFTQDFGTPIEDLPRYLAGDAGGNPGWDNTLFDDGFFVDYVIGLSGGSPVGSRTRTYYLVNWTTIGDDADVNHTNQIAGLVTAGDPTASGSTPGTLGPFLMSSDMGILGAADNSNVDGVEGAPGDPGGLAVNDPLSATTGFEFAIPLSLLGVGIGDTVCLFAGIGSSDGFLSNQILPTDDTATEFANLGARDGGFETLDFGDVSGDQYVCYTLVEGGCPNEGCENGDLDGDCDVDLTDLSTLLAEFGTIYDLEDLSLLLTEFGNDCT